MTTATDTPARLKFENKAVYEGVIRSQRWGTDRSDRPQLLLGVAIKAKLRDGFDAAAGSDPCTDAQQADAQTVYLNLDPGNPRADLTFKNLRLLGFQGDNVSTLHPDHPECQSLVGKACHVLAKHSDDGQKIFWNFVNATPKQKFSLADAKKFFADNAETFSSLAAQADEQPAF